MVMLMDKKGFTAMYMIYSLFLVFILMMLTVLLINNYKSNFLNILKTDIKEDLKERNLEAKPEITLENSENSDI